MNLINLFFKNISFSQIIFKNTSWMIVANIVAKISKFFLMVIIARYVEPNIFGNFNYIIVLSGVCFGLSEIGMSMLIIREYQQQKIPEKKLFSAGWALKIMLISINSLFAIIAVYFISNELKGVFLIFSLMNILDGLKMYKIALARTQNNRQHEAICLVIETLTTTILGIILIIQTKSITLLAVAYLVGSILSSIYIWIKTAYVSIPFKYAKWEDIRYLFKKSIIFIFSAFLIVALSSIDTLMIKWIEGPEGVGFYQAGLKITDTVLIIPMLFMTTLFPFTSKYINDPDRLISIIKTSISIMIMIALPIIIGGNYIASSIIITIFTAEYVEAILPFKFLLIAILPIFVISILNGVFLSTNRENLSVTLGSISFALNIILNILLIPKFGIIGAVYGTLISRVILLILMFSSLSFIFKKKLIEVIPIIKYIFFSIVMLIGLEISTQYFINPLVLIITGGIIYFVCLLVSKDKNMRKVTELLKRQS